MVGCESRHHRDGQEPGGEAEQREAGQECPRQHQVAAFLFIHKTGTKVVFDSTFSMLAAEPGLFLKNLCKYILIGYPMIYRSGYCLDPSSALPKCSDPSLESGS